MRMYYKPIVALFMVLFFLPSVVNAQGSQDELSSVSDADVIVLGGAPDSMSIINERIQRVQPNVNVESMSSLFFTPSEESLIQEARLGLTTRAPTAAELQGDGTNVPVGPRELALGGIIYTSRGDWSVWLNGQQITPKRLPKEILDITVRKNYIKLKWFDAYTNQIFPIKLKPHQRFNIDTRIFLPGESKQEVASQF